jgi:hypothetical protein
MIRSQMAGAAFSVVIVLMVDSIADPCLDSNFEPLERLRLCTLSNAFQFFEFRMPALLRLRLGLFNIHGAFGTPDDGRAESAAS